MCFKLVTSPYTVQRDGEEYISITPAETATMKVKVSNNSGEVAYQWFRYSHIFERYIPIHGAESASYTISGNTKAGTYYCEATDTATGAVQKAKFYVTVLNDFSLGDTTSGEITLDAGAATELQVHATGGKLFYRWFRREYNIDYDYYGEREMIDGARTDSLTVSGDKRRMYECEVSDQYGNLGYVSYSVKIENGFSVSFGETNFEVNPGDEVTLSVTGSCTNGLLTYRWSRYEDNYGYTTVKESNESFLTIDAVGTDNYGYYLLYIFDLYGNTASKEFCVTVDNHLTAGAENGQVSFTVEPGDTVSMTVVAGCDSGELSYQWYREYRVDNGYGGYYWDEEIIIGAKSDSYTTGEMTKIENYYCRISDQYGNEEIVEFYIKLDNQLSASAAEDDEIWVAEGETATLTVTASCKYGSENITYQWEEYENDTDTLETDPVYEQKEYICYVTDEYGNTVSVRFRVGIDQTATISGTPISAGQSATANIEEAGGYNYFVFIPDETAYYRFCSEVDEQDTFGSVYNPGMEWLVEDDDGGTGNNFLIDYPFKAGRKYILAARYFSSDITGSFPVRLEIVEGLWKASAKTGDIYVDCNGSATMQVLTEERNAELTYTWKKMPSGEIIEAAGGDTLTIDSVTQYGRYVCTVSDQYGKQIDVEFWVHVNNPGLVISYEGTLNRNIVIGKTTTLEMSVSGNGSDEVQFRWYRNDNGENCLIEGETESSLTVIHGDMNAEYYCCTVTDQYGNETSFEFRIYTFNGFYAYAESGEIWVDAGNPATLSVNADYNAGSIHYQWYENEISPETILEGEESSTLTLENVQHRNTYYCRVSDDCGNIADLSIRVWVMKDNQLEASAENGQIVFYAEPGQTVDLNVIANCTDGDLYYQWYENVFHEVDGAGNTDQMAIRNATGASYTTEAITEYKEYLCRIEDEYCNYKGICFSVYPDSGLRVEEITDRDQSAMLNESIEFGVTATNNVDAQIQYKWTRTGYYDESYNWTATNETVGTGNTLTVSALREEEYECEVDDGYMNSCIRFRVDHVWDPEPVISETEVVYEWISKEQHLEKTIQHRHLKCIYDSCGTIHELPDNILENTPESHTVGEDGICSICHYLAEGSVNYETGLNNDLIVTGYGEITAEDITQYISSSTLRIRIGGEIARIGAEAFAGINHELHIDFLGGKLPYIDQNAFTGTTAVCRYYHDDSGWSTAGQYGGTLTWMYLPAYVEDDTYCYLVYGRDDIPGWEAMYLANDTWVYTPMTATQAMETTFRSREIMLEQIPETAALRTPYENHWKLVESIHFNGSCAAPTDTDPYCINLPAGLHPQFILEIQSSALNLEVNTADKIDSVTVRGSSTLTVKGDVHTLSVEKSDNSGSVTIQGNVDGLIFNEESNIENVYRGTLKVAGTVRHGSVYGTGQVCIPRIGAKDENGNETDLEINWNNMVIGEFDNVTQSTPIAENGQVTIPGFTTSGARYSKDNCRVHYYWCGDSWRVDFEPKNQQYSTGNRPSINNVCQYKEDFSLSDVLWGEDTVMWVENHGIDEDIIQIDGQLDDLGIFNSHVQINSRVHQVSVYDYWNEDGKWSDVTINGEVEFLQLDARNGMPFQVRTGANGSVAGGSWERCTYGTRLFGRIGSSRAIYSDNHISVMSWRDGDQTKAILPTVSEINTAAGLGTDHQPMMDVRDDSVYVDDEERRAINELLESEAWQDTSELNKIVSIFSIQIEDYTNTNGGMNYCGEITDLHGNEIDVIVNNPAEGRVRIMRLHNENGTITADAVSDATEQDEITVSSDRFSRFVVMSDTATRPFITSSGQYTWYNGNGVSNEWPEQGGVYGCGSIGNYYIPYEERDEEADDPIWSMEWISGPDCFRLDDVDDAYWRCITPKDGEISQDITGEARYRISAEYNGITYMGDVRITLDNTDMSSVELGASIASFDPDTLTIGDWHEAGRTVTIESGKMYVLRGAAVNTDFSPEEWSFTYYSFECLTGVDKYQYRQPDGSELFQDNDVLWRAGTGAGKETQLLELQKIDSNLRMIRPLTVCITATGWDMTLPSGLTDIEPYAFEGISARSVMIPYGCCRIGEGAFAGAASLERIYIPVTVYEIGDNAIPEGAVICTPEGSTAWYWAETNNRDHAAQ